MTHTPLLSALLLAGCAALALPAGAAEATGCAAKRERLEAQLEEAKSQGNRDRQAGLEKALGQVVDHCDDASLHKTREEKVLEAEHEVRTREAELEKALKKGDPAKIDKRKTKLAEAREELRQAQEALQR
ncbi:MULTISPECIES: DUF1090 domain-containing protein [unclassified Pseudomonas]|uniref:DUF1090 domain-containing protein n=1 Tax=unclassified Pseudomonas TaxID=196821 RepID=UPI0024490275|nr:MULTISPECIES: DUF1090 domain-containing protein [unclassified Pseudomonas]MDG9926576.1 DUF1090 domain-containing protein [Pseudomonas sp. GD04042]MDH0481340.1 DUF1090 domain-containing protein [Pseudomonas sp. GD04015]MDH0603289.1 DUF1090 domain-containing protein [Pseudomonas sp. GD03869]